MWKVGLARPFVFLRGVGFAETGQRGLLAMKQKIIERMAMAAWAAHRGIASDIQARWSALSEHDEGHHWRMVATAAYNAEHKKTD
jgi:hypothetical protein